jgi:uncharacterized protein RhaS with RHS repeats
MSYNDSATGMYDYGYRDYMPEVARFTTLDPVRDGANWFAYVNNDPVNWVDAWGLSASEAKSSFWGIVGDIVGKIIAAPITIVGLVVGTVLTAVSVITGHGGNISITNNAITFTTGLNLGGSITLGNTVLHAGGNVDSWNSSTTTSRYDGTAKVNLGQHEEEHTKQYEKYGVLMPIIWGISAIHNGGIGNSGFEVAADDASEIPGTRR